MLVYDKIKLFVTPFSFYCPSYRFLYFYKRYYCKRKCQCNYIFQPRYIRLSVAVSKPEGGVDVGNKYNGGGER